MTTDASTRTPEDRLRSEELASRVGAQVYDLEVVESRDLTPSMRRVTMTSKTLHQLSFEPGQDLMLAVAKDGDVVHRRFTIRHLDPAASLISVDFTLHGEGPAARWAASARPGQVIEAIAPRGKVVLAKDVDWHLFAGDDAFLPAALTMAEAVRAPQSVIVVLEVDSPADEQPHGVEPSVGKVTYVHREGRPRGESAMLSEALSALELPPGAGHAYLGGEHKVVSALRELLIARGMAASDLSPKSYWRKGVANANHGEPPRD
jgi:NADPH-dependent ferric siderophore reductase